MATHAHNWLKTSLFYDHQSIGDLLSNGIRTFLQVIEEKKSIHGYTIELSNSGGKHVNFSILTNQNHAPSLAKAIDRHFKVYFSKTSNANHSALHSFHDIFAPFSPNTIQYGIYDLVDITSDEEQRTYHIAFILSRLLLEEAIIDNDDDNTIFTIGFYLHLALTLSIIKMDKGRSYLNSCFSEFSQIFYKQSNSKHIEAKFYANKEVVLDMFDDVVECGKKQNHFVNRWMAVCENELMPISDDNSFYLKCEYIKRVINKYLNINQQMFDLIFFYQKESLCDKSLINFKNVC